MMVDNGGGGGKKYQKNDYVICERPLRVLIVYSIRTYKLYGHYLLYAQSLDEFYLAILNLLLYENLGIFLCTLYNVHSIIIGAKTGKARFTGDVFGISS